MSAYVSVSPTALKIVLYSTVQWKQAYSFAVWKVMKSRQDMLFRTACFKWALTCFEQFGAGRALLFLRAKLNYIYACSMEVKNACACVLRHGIHHLQCYNRGSLFTARYDLNLWM
jgi:hypothetical protein